MELWRFKVYFIEFFLLIQEHSPLVIGLQETYMKDTDELLRITRFTTHNA